MAAPSKRRRPRTSGPRESPLRKQVEAERKSVYRQAVNAAAERVFAAKGTEASRMREIAAEAGISLGTLYGVIDGKQSLLVGIHRDRMLGFLDCIRAARDSHEGTLERHLAVLRRGGQYFLDRPDFLRMCCRDGYGWAAPIPTSGRRKEFWDEGASIPRELFERGTREGIYVDEDPELLVRKMLALKQVELAHWVDEGMQLAHERVLDRMEDQFIRAFCIRDL